VRSDDRPAARRDRDEAPAAPAGGRERGGLRARGADVDVLRAAGGVVALSRLPGIGKKTAERLIVEMRDRLSRLEDDAFVAVARPQAGGGAPSAVEDAVSALIALGYKAPDASRMVRGVASEGQGSEDLIRAALKAAAPQG
jgi:Holliday junction DNA helicase RuvA